LGFEEFCDVREANQQNPGSAKGGEIPPPQNKKLQLIWSFLFGWGV